MDYRPMQVSLATANIDCIRAVVKKARHDEDKIDHDKVNPFAIIASFPSIKERVDQSTSELVQGIDDMIGTYQLDGDDAYSFGRERQYAWFQAHFKHIIGRIQRCYLLIWVPPFSLPLECCV